MGYSKKNTSRWVRNPDQRVAIWLTIVAIMVASMVVIGGITRVTGSGLSMVEWRPLLGWLPPLDDREWGRIFKLYQTSPEYRHVNAWMNLGDFKQIFWWEYIHRLWGRLIGLVFFLPFVFFTVTQSIKKELRIRIVALFFLGGLQGGLGWWMVKSGLSVDPSVSQYRLATHLGVAFLILGLLIWTILDLIAHRKKIESRLQFYQAVSVMGLVSLTVVGGALVAGLDAGLVYNTFPLMGDRIVPPDYYDLEPFWKNIFENISAVQFNHRILAILTAIAVVIFFASSWSKKSEKFFMHPIYALLIVVTLQFSLGVLVLINSVPIELAVGHQFGGLCLFGTSVWALWSVSKGISLRRIASAN
ncbi:COX15/CtaA family protein [Alphaproteobacteria bacterium]|nr:COX15/CtaA family protein [Alphaproteobacteria bacterium]